MSTPDHSERPPEEQDNTETPEPGEHAVPYEDPPTAVLPGSDRTVTGTAVNNRPDHEGKPI